MKLNVAITCPRELDLKGRPDGEVSITVSNQSGGPLKVKAEAVAIDEALKGCLEIVKGEKNWEFADKGTHQITVRVKAPAGAPEGKARFQLQLADQATPDEVGANGPEILVLAGTAAPVTPGGGAKWWIFVVIAAVLVVAGVVVWLVARPRDAVIPNLTGVEFTEAVRRLKEIGLDGVEAEKVITGSVEPGQVAKQGGQPGTKVPRGSVINLYVEGVPPEPAVPSLIGMVPKAALDLLGKLGLKGEERGQVTTKKVAPGKVADQTVAAKTKVPKGTVVGLFVEAEPVDTVVPNVFGKPFAQALDSLKAAGLQGREKPPRVIAGNVSAGAVVDQDPNAGVRVLKGTMVVLQIKADTVKVPKLVGLQAEAAVRQLHGLKLGRLHGKRTGLFPVTNLQVKDQSPDPGTEVLRGTAVDLTFDTTQLFLDQLRPKLEALVPR